MSSVWRVPGVDPGLAADCALRAESRLNVRRRARWHVRCGLQRTFSRWAVPCPDQLLRPPRRGGCGMATLKKVKPYRSQRARAADGVYHDRSDCPIGRLVHSEDIAAGAGALPRCPECIALDIDSNARLSSSEPVPR